MSHSSNNHKPEFNVIAIGDTTQDIFLKMHDASLQCDTDKANCKICFDYADKIAVDQKTDIAAVGNAANHAIGVARLGLKSGIYTVVGDDDQGQKALSIFRANGVDPRFVKLDEQRGTNLSIVINYKSERTILVYHEPRDYVLPDNKDTEWIYLTSASGGGVNQLHDQMVDFLTRHEAVKLAFNPGTHQIHLGRDKLLPLLKRTNLLFLNREEAAEILGVETRNVRELAGKYHEIGVKMMVLTDGPDGSYVSDGKDIWYVGIFEGPVVERTGAGDAFGSGFLSAIIKGKAVPEAMLWGNANSTSVVQYIGAREGLLTEEAVGKMIEENASVVPELYQGE